MVYIGTFNSGAAKVSIPILCKANLGMISPANTYPGLAALDVMSTNLRGLLLHRDRDVTGGVPEED